jgi:hypothetical protein
MEPREGLLTYSAEGNNIPSSMYYSRKIHWPGNIAGCSSAASGVTIGRGYDLGSRSRSDVLFKLMAAGIPRVQAEKIAAGAGLKYCHATEFVRANRDKIGEISESQQLRLFEIVYPEYVTDSIRFYNKYKKHGAVSWDNMSPRLRDVFVDMKYQGVMSGMYMRYFEKNSPQEVIGLIKEILSVRKNNRFMERLKYLDRNS